MKVGYTEFSFGYAFTENLIRSSTTAPVGAPVFPNLVQEAQTGYDIKIDFPGVPLFFQFKLPELMRRSTAFEVAKLSCAGLQVPFFRIAMMRRDLSDQHKLLIELEKNYPSGVFYTAPFIAGVPEFDNAYNQAAVAGRSKYFSPIEIGPLPDDRPHSIAYRANLNVAFFRSEPRELKAISLHELTARVRSDFDHPRFRAVGNSARELREAVLSLASAPIRAAESQIAERVVTRRRVVGVDRPQPASEEAEQVTTDLLVAREIARIDLGVDLVIAQPR